MDGAVVRCALCHGAIYSTPAHADDPRDRYSVIAAARDRLYFAERVMTHAAIVDRGHRPGCKNMPLTLDEREAIYLPPLPVTPV